MRTFTKYECPECHTEQYMERGGGILYCPRKRCNWYGDDSLATLNLLSKVKKGRSA